MYAGEAQKGDQLWDPHAPDGSPIEANPLQPEGSQLIYTVEAQFRPDTLNVVLMVQYAVDGGRDGRVFLFDQEVPLFRPPELRLVLDPETADEPAPTETKPPTWGGPV